MNLSGRWISVAILLIVVVGFGLWVNRTQSKKETASVTSQPNASELPYAPAEGVNLTLERIATDLGTVTRISFTPDNKFMLAALLTSEIYAFRRAGSRWERQAKPTRDPQTNDLVFADIIKVPSIWHRSMNNRFIIS